MFAWLTRSVKDALARRRAHREAAPKAFRDLSRELRELAEIASRVWPEEESFQNRIRGIREEMDQLDELTSKPEFRLLPLKKRLELRESLLHSKTQLMDTVSTAPPPTMRPQ
jgi:predicted nuclease with TOPRIM domain